MKRRRNMKRVRNTVLLITAMLMLIIGSAVGVHAASGMTLTVTSVTEKNATVKWNAVSGAASYLVAYEASTDTGKAKSVTVNAKTTSYTLALPKDTVYYLAVGAKDASGKTIAYTDAFALAALPGKVTGAEVARWNQNGTVATVTVNNNPAPNTWSGIEYKFLTSKGKTVKTGSFSSYPYAVSGLSSKQIYKLSVREYIVLGTKTFYGPWYTKWVVPEPKLLTPKIASGTKIKVRWRKVKGATKYVVYGSTSPTKGYKKIKTVSKKKSSYIVSKVKKKKLKAYQNYYFKVVAYKGKVKSTSGWYTGGHIYYRYS